MAGQLAELKTETIPSTYPELNPARVHVVLVEMAEHLLAPFDDSLRKYALRELIKRGVDVRLKTAISEVHADRVDFKDGSSMPVDLVIWAAGVAGEPGDAGTGGCRSAGRVGSRSTTTPRVHRARAHLRHRRREHDRGEPAAAAGPAGHADGQARGASRSPGCYRGLETEKFSYYDKGTMATIGRGDAVLQMPNGIKLTGVIAWLGWIALHIVFLLGGRNRVQTLINLGSRYAGPRRSNAIVGDVMEPPKMRMQNELDQADVVELAEREPTREPTTAA